MHDVCTVHTYVCTSAALVPGCSIVDVRSSTAYRGEMPSGTLMVSAWLQKLMLAVLLCDGSRDRTLFTTRSACCSGRHLGQVRLLVISTAVGSFRLMAFVAYRYFNSPVQGRTNTDPRTASCSSSFHRHAMSPSPRLRTASRPAPYSASRSHAGQTQLSLSHSTASSTAEAVDDVPHKKRAWTVEEDTVLTQQVESE